MMIKRTSQAQGTLAVIIGRAGSKGLPGKNAMLIGGRPAVCWSIDAARHAHLVNAVVVSTDCAGVEDAADRMGVTVLERSEELASDEATVDDAVRDAVLQYEAATNQRIERVVILYANVPVRPADLVDRAVRTLIETQADSVQSYAPVGKRHPWWTVRIADESGIVSAFDGGALNHGAYRRQDLPAAFVPDGGVIALTREALMLEIKHAPEGPHRFLGCDIRGIETEEGDVVDIDSPTDAQVASAILNQSQKRITA
jgi:CMP-N-acetylneuraminic acid synthetase